MPYRYKKKRKKAVKGQAKRYLYIIIVCFFVAVGLTFVEEEVPNLLQRKILEGVMVSAKILGEDLAKGIDAETVEDIKDHAERTLGKKLDVAGIVELKKSYDEGKMDAATVKRLKGYAKKALGNKMGSSRVNRLKKAYKEKRLDTADVERVVKELGLGKIDQSNVERARQAYGKGKIDSSKIKRAKEAYRRGELDPALIKRAKMALASGR